MTDLHFAAPQWADAFYPLAALIAALVWLERRRGGSLGRFVSAALQDRLVRECAPWRRTLRIAFLAISCALLVVALMRPQWGMRTIAAPTFGAEIMICLDVSKSMLAEDVAPNRLERAKAEIADLLTYLDGHQVGIIAFAGRASVLSPLTPDFSFLRLVLDGIGVHSVTRGGTKLEEPIRKAVAGFGEAGDAARVILLITDGEDHDSFPLDAAAAAAERGIRIITIGFGDERGSEIHVTDPRSGARLPITDSDGRPVVSRLDGELLREIALATGGAYVPAGTGLLDLESIYEQHIRRLTRGRATARSKVVRDEMFQWAILLALAFLVSSAIVSGGRVEDRSVPLASALLLLGTIAPLLGAASAALAQPSGGDDAPIALEPEPATAGEDVPSEAAPAPAEPREIYNTGIAALEAGELEDALHDFRRARSAAGDDAALRFDATYNLGWVLAERAAALQESDPEQALRLLYETADWFREAIRLRPDDEDVRHNLEVVLNRSLLLADALAKRGEDDLEARLEKLAASQRGAAAGVAALDERVSAEEGPHVSPALQAEFRAAATLQRTMLSDADALAKRFAEEFEGILSTAEDERSPEDQMRAVQLENVLHYMHRARERMGQARSQLRRREATRAYRRASAALAELKRAQDQLKDPVAVLDRVIASATEIATYTAVAASASGPLRREGALAAPAWLTPEYLFEEQGSVAERVGELHLRLQVGEAPPPAEAERALEAVRAAEPFIGAAHEALTEAERKLEAEDLRNALQAQRRGIEALQEARERFLDLRGLLETLYADERRILAVLSSEEEEVRAGLNEFLPSLRVAERRNLDRAERLQSMIDDEHSELRTALSGDAETGGEGADPEALETGLERLDAATSLLRLARAEMEDARRSLGVDDSGTDADFEAAALRTQRAVDHLASLRRLFFSIAELVRDIAERQLEVADATQDLAALEDSAAAEAKLGPLMPRQESLAKSAESIALELERQSQQPAPDPSQDPALAEEASARLRLAGEHLLYAHEAMQGALEAFDAEPSALEEARTHQESALLELARALEELTPPEPRDQTQQGEGEQQQGEGQQQPQSGDEREPGGMDPQQLLQGVRDREAQRREQREGRSRSGYETVEKDW